VQEERLSECVAFGKKYWIGIKKEKKKKPEIGGAQTKARALSVIPSGDGPGFYGI
jgi:hypothetical protein